MLICLVMLFRRALAASLGPVVLVSLVASCGGRLVLPGSVEEDSGTTSTDDGGTSVVDAGSDTGITGRHGPGSCIDLTVSPSALSCVTDSDCTIGLTGRVCDGDCPVAAPS